MLDAHMQERLAFRAQGVISHLIDGYRANPALRRTALSAALSLADGQPVHVTEVVCRGELDYPAMLIAHQLKVKASAPVGASDVAAPSSLRFPPLDTTLSLLAEIHRGLERGSFEVLAKDAVEACTRALVVSARVIIGLHDAEDRAAATAGAKARPDSYIAQRVTLTSGTGGEESQVVVRGPDTPSGALSRGVLAAAVNIIPVPGSAPRSATLDSSLFLVRSLLTLREHLSPYHVQVREKSGVQ
jgi:hypothetical protein